MAYIDRDIALKLLKRNSITEHITFSDGVSIYDTIANIPTADVAPKREVAREIFAEIEYLLKIVKIPCVNEEGYVTPLRAGYWAIDPNDYNELKKKYTNN